MGDAAEEGWWEPTQDEEGNTYYYHTVTGETTWENPYGGDTTGYDTNYYSSDYNQEYYSADDQGGTWDQAAGWGDTQQTYDSAGAGYDHTAGYDATGGAETDYGYTSPDGTGGGAYPGYEYPAEEGYDSSGHAHDPTTAMQEYAGEWEAQVDESGTPYWYNHATGMSSWTDPYAYPGGEGDTAALVPASEEEGYWQAMLDDEGNTYYAHNVTGETRWDNPYEEYPGQMQQQYDPAYYSTDDAAPVTPQRYAGGYDATSKFVADEEAAKLAAMAPEDRWLAQVATPVSPGEAAFSPGEDSQAGDSGALLEALEGELAADAMDAEAAARAAADKRRAEKEEEARLAAEAEAAIKKMKKQEEREMRREARRKKKKAGKEDRAVKARLMAMKLRNQAARQREAMKARVAEVKEKVTTLGLERPCQQCLERESTAVCKECMEIAETPYCNECWEDIHSVKEAAHHKRHWYAQGLTDRLSLMADKGKRRTRRAHDRELREIREARDAAEAAQWSEFVDHLKNTAWYNSVTGETVYERPWVLEAVEQAWRAAESRAMRAEDLRRLTVRREQRVYERRHARAMRALKDTDYEEWVRVTGGEPEKDDGKGGALVEWHPNVKKLLPNVDNPEVHFEKDSDDTWTDDHWSSEEEGLKERPPPPSKLPPPPPPPPPKPLGARKKKRRSGQSETKAPELTEEEKVALAAATRTNKEARRLKRQKKAARETRKRRKQLKRYLAAREKAMQEGEVWEMMDDGLGNVNYRNVKTQATLIEHPIKRARRLFKEHCAKAGIRLQSNKDDEYLKHYAGGGQKELVAQYLMDMKINAAADKEEQAASKEVREAAGVVVGGRLIRIITYKDSTKWKATPHNHLYIFCDGREYCVTCRRQKREFLDEVWKRKRVTDKSLLESKFRRENVAEERRIKHVKNIDTIYHGGREVARRHKMDKKGKRAEVKKFEAFMTDARQKRKAFEAKRREDLVAEKNRQAMEDDELAMKGHTEARLRERESVQMALQESMREEWLQLVNECVGQERLKHLSWQRGICRGTYSSFHIVRDVNAGERFVVKNIYIRKENVERKVRYVAEWLMEKTLPCQSLMRVVDVFKHGVYPPKQGGLRRGAQVFMMLEYCTGGKLYDRLRRKPEPTMQQRFDWILQATIAVAWMHRNARAHDGICTKALYFKDNTRRALLKLGSYIVLPIESRGTTKLRNATKAIMRLKKGPAAVLAKYADRAGVHVAATPAEKLGPETPKQFKPVPTSSDPEVGPDPLLADAPAGGKEKDPTLPGDPPTSKLAMLMGSVKAPPKRRAAAGPVQSMNGAPALYAAPERLEFFPPSNAADVWSLGCVIFEIVTGKDPFLRGKPWNYIVNEVPMDVAPLVLPMLKCALQLEPEKRCSSLQLLMYLRSVPLGRMDMQGDVSIFPETAELESRSLRIPKDKLYALAEKKKLSLLAVDDSPPPVEDKPKRGKGAKPPTKLYSPIHLKHDDVPQPTSPYPGPVLLKSPSGVGPPKGPDRNRAVFDGLTHKPAPPYTAKAVKALDDPLLREMKHQDDALRSLGAKHLPDDARIVSLAPKPRDTKSALDRVPGAVVASNPLAPLYHTRGVLPDFRGPKKEWVPKDAYTKREKVVDPGSRRVKLRQLPRIPLPKPKYDDDGVRTLQRSVALGEGIVATDNPLAPTHRATLAAERAAEDARWEAARAASVAAAKGRLVMDSKPSPRRSATIPSPPTPPPHNLADGPSLEELTAMAPPKRVAKKVTPKSMAQARGMSTKGSMNQKMDVAAAFSSAGIAGMAPRK